MIPWKNAKRTGGGKQPLYYPTDVFNPFATRSTTVPPEVSTEVTLPIQLRISFATLIDKVPSSSAAGTPTRKLARSLPVFPSSAPATLSFRLLFLFIPRIPCTLHIRSALSSESALSLSCSSLGRPGRRRHEQVSRRWANFDKIPVYLYIPIDYLSLRCLHHDDGSSYAVPISFLRGRRTISRIH